MYCANIVIMLQLSNRLDFDSCPTLHQMQSEDQSQETLNLKYLSHCYYSLFNVNTI